MLVINTKQLPPTICHMLLSITVSSCLLLLHRSSESTLPHLIALISYLLIKGVKSPAPFPVFQFLHQTNPNPSLPPPSLSLSLSLFLLINSISNTWKAYLWDSWTELINSEAEWLTQVHNTWMALIHCGHFHSNDSIDLISTGRAYNPQLHTYRPHYCACMYTNYTVWVNWVGRWRVSR